MWAKRHTKFDKSIDQPFLQLVSILGPTHFFTQFLHNFLTSQLPENPAGPNWCKRNSRKQREPHGPQMKKNDDFLLLYITPSFMATEQLLKHKNHFFLNLFLAFHITHNVPKNKPSLNKNQKKTYPEIYYWANNRPFVHVRHEQTRTTSHFSLWKCFPFH